MSVSLQDGVVRVAVEHSATSQSSVGADCMPVGECSFAQQRLASACDATPRDSASASGIGWVPIDVPGEGSSGRWLRESRGCELPSSLHSAATASAVLAGLVGGSTAELVGLRAASAAASAGRRPQVSLVENSPRAMIVPTSRPQGAARAGQLL